MAVNQRSYLVHSMNRDFFFEGARIVDIWAGHRTSFALDENGNLWSWGYNNYGQLGYPTNSGFRDSDRSYTPKRSPINWASYGGIQKFICSSSEANNDFIVLLDGQNNVWTQGYNGQGQLGQGNTTNGSNSSTIARRSQSWSTGSLSGQCANVWADCDNSGHAHLWVRKRNGETYACGYNGNRNLTDGGTTNQTTPVPIYQPGASTTLILKNVVTVAAGGRSGGTTQSVLTDSGHVYACGWNGYGEGRNGTSGQLTNNNIRYQQNGQRQYALGRCLGAPYYHMSPTDNNYNQIKMDSHPWGGAHCIDIHHTGDYEGNISHTARSAHLYDNGELTHAGRDYDWGFGQNRSHIWGAVNGHLLG